MHAQSTKPVSPDRGPKVLLLPPNSGAAHLSHTVSVQTVKRSLPLRWLSSSGSPRLPGFWTRGPALSILPQPAISAREEGSWGAGGPAAPPNSSRPRLPFAALDRSRPPAVAAPPPPRLPSPPPLTSQQRPRVREESGLRSSRVAWGGPRESRPGKQRGVRSQSNACPAEAAYRRPRQRPSPQPNKRASLTLRGPPPARRRRDDPRRTALWDEGACPRLQVPECRASLGPPAPLSRAVGSFRSSVFLLNWKGGSTAVYKTLQSRKLVSGGGVCLSNKRGW